MFLLAPQKAGLVGGCQKNGGSFCGQVLVNPVRFVARKVLNTLIRRFDIVFRITLLEFFLKGTVTFQGLHVSEDDNFKGLKLVMKSCFSLSLIYS